MTKVLVVNDGKRERELLLVERLVVGRDPACDISVEDGLLSRRHAEFVASAQAVTVRDLGSRNGIFVNGTRRAQQTLRQGDVVQIGPLRVRYLADRAGNAGAPTGLDSDGTVMIPLEPGKAPVPPVSFPLRDLDEELEGETRVISATPSPPPIQTPARDNDLDAEATSFTPTPTPRPAPIAAALAAAKAQAVPLPAPAPPTMPAASAPDDRALAGYVRMQLGSLAIIVFVSTIMPVIVARGAVLRAVDDGSLPALLLWPFLPLAIALTATIVVANLVNRRVLDAMKDGRKGAEGR